MQLAYRRQLQSAIVGEDVDVLLAMTDTKTGLPATHKGAWSPPIEAIREFIDRKMEFKRSQIGWKMDEIEAIERRIGAKPIASEDERAANVERLRRLAKEIRSEGKPDWRSEPMQAVKALPGQGHDPEALLASLANLDAMRGGK
jgi:hypothetical protein